MRIKELHRNPLVDYLEAEIDSRLDILELLPPRKIRDLETNIRRNLLDIFKHKLRASLSGYSVELHRKSHQLEMRHRILMALRFPVIEVKGLNSRYDKPLLTLTTIRSSPKKQGPVSNTLTFQRGTIWLESLHEFPVLQHEWRKVLKDTQISDSPYGDVTTDESDMKHEMGHLFHILNSSGGAIPLVGIKILYMLDGLKLHLGIQPLASYLGTLEFEELKQFHAGDLDDMSSSDKAVSDFLNTIS